MKLSVLVPAYNEERTIETIVRKVVTARLLPAVELELLIHDDASTDQTPSILSRLQQEFQNIRVIRRDRNGGKGAGIRTLIREASGDVCLFQDADEEYDPADYATLLERYQQGGWPAVYGYRNLHGQPLIGQLGNHSLTVLTNVFYGCWLRDMETCYKLIDARLLRLFELQANGYDIEPEITINLRKRGYRIAQVPIHYHPRPTPSKKLRRLTDGWLALSMILRHRLPGAPPMAYRPIDPPQELENQPRTMGQTRQARE